MYKKDLSRFVLGVVLSFVLVCAFGYLCVSAFRREASLVARGTLPGLMYAGAASNQTEENFLAGLNLAGLKTPAEQDRCMQQIETGSKKAGLWLKKYEEGIVDAEDRANFNKVLEVRKEYAKERENFFGLVRGGRHEEAVAFFHSTVEPAFDRYRMAETTLFDYNVRVGESHGKKLLSLSYATPIVVGLFGVVIFIAGALAGFKTTLP